MENIKFGKIKFKTIIFAILTGVAVSMDMGIPDLHLMAGVERETILGMPEIAWNVYGSINWLAAFLLSLFFVFVWAVYDELKSNFSFPNIGNAILSLGLAVVFWLSQGFAMEDSLGILVKSTAQIAKSCLFCLGYSLLFFLIFSFGYYFLVKKGLCRYDKYPKKSKLFLCYMITWLPHLIISYPGMIAGDTYIELRSYYGLTGFSSINPIFHVIYTGLVFESKRILGDNGAVFLYCLIQSVFFAWVLAHMMELLGKMRLSKLLFYIVLAVQCTMPYYTNYISWVVKDSLYSYCFVLFMTEVVYIMVYGKEVYENRKHIALFVLSAMGTVLFRVNGKYLVYPVLLIMGVACLCLKEELKKKCVYLVMLILPVVLSFGITKALAVAFNEKVMPAGDILASVPIQQTARYVKYYGNEVTEEERKAISLVLDYDKIAEEYNTRVSDDVKALYRCDSEEDRSAYLNTWFKMGLKHPGTYIAATLNQNYYMLYTGVPNNIALVGAEGKVGIDEKESAEKKSDLAQRTGVDINSPSFLYLPRKLLFLFYQAYFFCPVLGLLAHPAFYNIIFLALLIYALRDKVFSWLLLAVPIVLNLAIYFVGPAIQRHPRYMFPVIFCVPLLMGYYLYLRNKKLQ